jgi:hypothetical protein
MLSHHFRREEMEGNQLLPGGVGRIDVDSRSLCGPLLSSSVELETNSSREELEGVSVLFRIEDIEQRLQRTFDNTEDESDGATAPTIVSTKPSV